MVTIKKRDIKPADFSAYWCGYRDNGTPTHLDNLPSYIDTVPLAFANPQIDSTLSTSFLCTDFTAETILGWSKVLQQRGQKVTMSLIDSPKVHWTDIDLDVFTNSAKLLMDKWGLDGFDIDGEGPAIMELIKLVPLLRNKIGDKPIITYTCYTGSEQDTQILQAINKDINWIQLMAYGSDFESMISLAEHYASIVGKEKVSIGVKVGVTPLSEITQLGQWVKDNGYHGMMLWSADMDNPSFTHKKLGTWTEAVRKSLESVPEEGKCVQLCRSLKNKIQRVFTCCWC